MEKEKKENETDIELDLELTPKQIKKFNIIIMLWGILLLIWIYLKGWI